MHLTRHVRVYNIRLVGSRSDIRSNSAIQKIIVVPEGANMPEAVQGALTLGLDILRNEEELGTGIYITICRKRYKRHGLFHILHCRHRL